MFITPSVDPVHIAREIGCVYTNVGNIGSLMKVWYDSFQGPFGNE